MNRANAYLLMGLLCGATLSGCAQPSRESSQASSLLATIEVRGARAVLDSLWGTGEHGGFEAVIDSVETGDSTWLAVARELRAVSDAHASEELETGLSYALQHSPGRVLRMLGPGFALEDVCVGPFYDSAPEFERRFMAETIAALRRVREPSLLKVRDECLTNLRADRYLRPQEVTAPKQNS